MTEPDPSPTPAASKDKPRDWQNVVIQWLSVGLVAVVVLVAASKWRHRGATAEPLRRETVRLQVEPASRDTDAESDPELPTARVADATAVAASTARETSASVVVENREEPAAPVLRDPPEHVVETPSIEAPPLTPPNTVTASPPLDQSSVAYPRTNPTTYRYAEFSEAVGMTSRQERADTARLPANPTSDRRELR